MEVGDIRWLGFKDSIQIMRPYNIEKKNILFNLHNSIKDIIENFLEISKNI